VRVTAPNVGSGAVLVVTEWTPPVSNTDSLFVDASTFAPQREAFVSRALKFHYRYHGFEISGSLQRGDSAPRTIARHFHESPFAFNELESLVRSLRFTRGRSMIVPLFSEADAVLERDTIMVVADTVLADGQVAWIVRFADPVIVQQYLVDPTSRHTIRITTRQRKSGTLFDARVE
jgi:hypothetical protein